VIPAQWPITVESPAGMECRVLLSARSSSAVICRDPAGMWVKSEALKHFHAHVLIRARRDCEQLRWVGLMRAQSY